MALLSPRLPRSLLPYGVGGGRTRRARGTWCSAIAVDAPLASVSGIRWGSSKLQGPRSEMEDDVVVRSDGLDGFSFAAVFDGHAGFSSVEFLRNELYKECTIALQGGLLLTSKNFNAVRDAIQKAFQNVDSKLLIWLEQMGNEDDSGATATVMFLRNDVLIISHLGDSCVAISRTGKAEVLTNPHRPYGNNKVSLEEVKRIRAAGGWVELGSDVEFVLLASDGLWDYMKSSDAVTFVRDQLRQHGDVQLACEALAGAASWDRRSQDNISIVIADLGRTDWQNLPVQGPNFVYEISQAFATIGIVSLGIWISSFLLS
ncbi:probable protein phosphatase 2C 5 isoform X2 [Phoenix dactylifera]|uniref:protein-serine/threonine phosphatase n=1 Tax=Phoenix dactylifera TaxID=42345 RepID=A0A8B9AKA3_PHODC|nr:probable protein phosphatase 2C 5 isoform X2 [Phoenix dactylifera]